VELRGSAFGLLVAVQSFGNLAASAIVGLLWAAVSSRMAFGCLIACMLLALVGESAAGRSSGDPNGSTA
jgi:dipeptide/tripeptide permease